MPFLPVGSSAQSASSLQTQSLGLRSLFKKKLLPADVLALFCTKMGVVFESGLAVEQGIPLLCDASKNRTFLREMRDVQISVFGGSLLSDALEKTEVFPEFLCGYIKIGEQTGRLGLSCVRLAEFYNEKSAVERELRTSLRYPLMLSVMMLMLFMLAIIVVLPGFEDIFSATDAALPAITYQMIGFSRFFGDNIVFIAALACAAVLFVMLVLRSRRGARAVDQALLKLPLAKKWANYSIAQAVSLLLDGGYSIARAIPEAAQTVGNLAVRRDIYLLSAKMEHGETFGRSLADIPYIDPIFAELANLGCETGNLSEIMKRLCSFLGESYRRSLRDTSKLIPPAVTFVLGTLLLVIVLSVVLPTFEIAGAF